MRQQVRHRPLIPLEHPREIVLVCAPLRSRVNLSSIVRTAGCCGITEMIACGNAKVDPNIARDGASGVHVEQRGMLLPVLRVLRERQYTLVGLEQTNDSVNLHEYRFPKKTALVIGNERAGLDDDELALMDACVEIPVWGLPHSYNVATATAMGLYEYCRQHPSG